MKKSDILKDGVIDTPAVPAVETKTPSISEEEFRELALLKGRQLDLQSRGFHLHEFLEIRKAEVEEAERQLTEVRTNLQEVTQQLDARFSDHMAANGLEGNVAVSDTPDENGRYALLPLDQNENG